MFLGIKQEHLLTSPHHQQWSECVDIDKIPNHTYKYLFKEFEKYRKLVRNGEFSEHNTVTTLPIFSGTRYRLGQVQKLLHIPREFDSFTSKEKLLNPAGVKVKQGFAIQTNSNALEPGTFLILGFALRTIEQFFSIDKVGNQAQMMFKTLSSDKTIVYVPVSDTENYYSVL